MNKWCNAQSSGKLFNVTYKIIYLFSIFNFQLLRVDFWGYLFYWCAVLYITFYNGLYYLYDIKFE